MLYVFGAFLVLTGIKMLVMIDREFDIGANPILKFPQRRLRVTPAPVGNRFCVRQPAPDYAGGPPSREPGKPLVWWARPLFLALVVIEVVDIIFAVDSVPAIFALNLFGKLPAGISLSVTLGLLLAGVVYSLYRTRREGTGATIALRSSS